MALQVHLETAGGAEREDRRRVEGDRQALLESAGSAEVFAHERLRRNVALIPGLHGEEDRGGVVAEGPATDEIEARERHRVLDVRVLLHRRDYLLHHLVGALERGAVGKDHERDVEALVLVGYERARREPPQAHRDRHHDEKDHRGDGAAPHHPRDPVLVAVGGAREDAVEPLEEPPRLLVLALEDDDRERRREREGDDTREDDRDRDRDGELAVELAREAAEERDRDEHRAQHQHDRDDRARDFLHSLDRGFARIDVLLVHDALDVLQDDDRVVHHDADRQDHAEEGERVDGIAQRQQPRERAEQRHRHRGERNQRRAPVLQEDEHHQEHEQHRLAQRDHHLADRDLDEKRGVVDDLLLEAGREALGELGHRRVHFLGDVERVRPGLQEDADQGGAAVVDAPHEAVVARGELDARDVRETQARAVGIGADDDVLEFLRLREPSLRRDGVDELLAAAGGRLAHLAGRELRVLLVDGARDVAGRKLQLREAVGPQPDAHGVVLGAEDLHVGGARHALHLVEHVERRVVRGEKVVAAAVGRVHRDHLEERLRALLDRDPLAPRFQRQPGLDLLHAVVDVERRLIDVHADVERDGDVHHALRRG